jgi:hypothetical protein
MSSDDVPRGAGRAYLTIPRRAAMDKWLLARVALPNASTRQDRAPVRSVRRTSPRQQARVRSPPMSTLQIILLVLLLALIGFWFYMRKKGG